MQEDPFPAAERILSDIESAFLKDPQLREFDILPITVSKNKSPVHHVENCLGLELWCVQYIYCYVYHRLLGARKQKNRRTDPETQARLLMGALLLNPDVQTFWNMRRELVQACRLRCKAELHFTAVVLSRKPKCSEAFSYRKWITTKIASGGDKEPSLVSKELLVARDAANRYANNYHAWQHCIWSIMNLVPNEVLCDVFLEEWTVTKGWANMHISDHSGWQYRQYLLQQLCGPMICDIPSTSVENNLFKYILPYCESESTSVEDDQLKQNFQSKNMFGDSQETYNTRTVWCVNFVLSEVYLNTDLITRYPGHEALWYHRRFLVSFLKSLLEQRICHDIGDENMGVHKKSDCASHSESVTDIKLHSYNIESDCDDLDSIDNQVSFEPCESLSKTLPEQNKKLLNLVAQALPRHEQQLLNICDGSDLNQQRFCSQYHKWLVKVLRLSVDV